MTREDERALARAMPQDVLPPQEGEGGNGGIGAIAAMLLLFGLLMAAAALMPFQ